jgi:hypothetical protein
MAVLCYGHILIKQSPQIHQRVCVQACYASGSTGRRLCEYESLLREITPSRPEDLKVLIDAFEDTLRTLKPTHREDALTTIIAKSIVELANQGERDPAHLRDFALKIVTAKKS